MKHLVNVTLLVEVDNESGIGEVEDAFFESLFGQLEGLEDTFWEMVENPDYDEMALDDEPTEEQEANGYFQASDDETEQEIEEGFTWTVKDATVESVKDIPSSVSASSVSAYQHLIAKRDAL